MLGRGLTPRLRRNHIIICGDYMSNVRVARKKIVCPACARAIAVDRRLDEVYKICLCGARWGVKFIDGTAYFVREWR